MPLSLVSRGAFARLWNSRFARNVAVMASGTAGAQAITMASAPVITRLYGPEAFGILGTFMAILAVMTPIAALNYPIASVLQRRDEDALGVLKLSAGISLGLTSILMIGAWFVGESAMVLLGAEAIGNFIYLLPLAMLFAAWMQMAQQWLIRKKAFGVVARSAVAHSLILNIAKAVGGLVHPVGAVLITLATLGNAFHAMLMLIGIRRKTVFEKWKPEDGQAPTVRELAIRHRDFPLYRMPQDLINAGSQSLPIFMLAGFFGPAAAGYYTLTKSVMGMPSALIGKSVYDVFYPRITAAARQGEDVVLLIVKATAGLLVIGILPFGIIIAFGPWLFAFVFGPDWMPAGEYARWLALFFFFNFINKPSVAAVPVIGIQRGLLVYEVLSTSAKVAGFAFGVYIVGDDVWAVAAFSLIGVFAYSAMILWILKAAKNRKWHEKTG